MHMAHVSKRFVTILTDKGPQVFIKKNLHQALLVSLGTMELKSRAYLEINQKRAKVKARRPPNDIKT